MSATICIQVRDCNINEVWTCHVPPSVTVGQFKNELFSFTKTPMRLALWFGSMVLLNSRLISDYDLKDGDELKIHDPTRFFNVSVFILIDTSPPPGDNEEWPSLEITASKMNTILDIKRMLQSDHSPEIFGNQVEDLEISEVAVSPSGDLILINNQEETADRVPLGDAVKIEELGFDVHDLSLWAKRVS